ncbi:MAG: LPS export ABC transporter ATP-binding protein [Gemmatimonadetes bacterium]|nr:LPS export ABC transporter ATP-binding protein [Gemmatimonadota bacterium]MYG16441.1 LPS export ABC transporter ATP-binding protein [Gemmatimonadota bacterium]
MGGSVQCLRAENLVKSYQNHRVVDDVSLRVDQGEVVGLLGPNGAGKTTSFYMIVGMIKPGSGRVLIDDRETGESRNITRWPMYRRARVGIGYLAQEPSIFRRMTVEQNLMSILQTLPMTRKARRQKMEDLLEDFGIAHLAKHKAYTLSGGERRRTEISRALVTEPKFILLDEPFAGIDPIAVEDIQEVIGRLKERKLGILVTDHMVRETLQITDRSYIMADGRIYISGTAKDLAEDPEARRIYLGERFRLE